MGLSQFLLAILTLLFVFAFAACDRKEGVIFPTPLSYSDALIIISGDANHRGVTEYSLGGSFQKSILNYRTAGGTLRGLAPFDDNEFLIGIDNTDRVERVSREGEISTIPTAYLGGTIYDIERSPLTGFYYILESNRVEVFDSTGTRQFTHYISTTIGACTMASPRGLEFNSSGNLIVTNTGATDDILVYDLSDPTNPVCQSAVAFGNDPYGVVAHSDGKLYITTTGDDAVYQTDADGSSAILLYQNITYINNPTAIVEHPNGDLIISSTVTDTIERMDTTGVRVTQADGGPFIRDVFSLNVTDILIIEQGSQ